MFDFRKIQMVKEEILLEIEKAKSTLESTKPLPEPKKAKEQARGYER
jgi:hypothetical protein